jgi:tetratricopeptide (TPR) repeat protein
LTDGQEQLGHVGGLWRVPVAGVGVALLVAGIGAAFLTRPEPDHRPAVVRADELIQRERYRDAIEMLNANVFPYVSKEQAPPDVVRGYHLLLARGLAGAHRELDVRLPVNDQNIVAQFLEAERLDATLTPSDQALLADSYIALGRFDEAARRIDLIGSGRSDLGTRMRHTLIRARITQGQPGYGPALEALARILSDPEVSESETLWALARQAEVRLAMGFADETVTQLLRELPVLQDADPVGLGELYKWLGRAYFELDALEEAERNLARADRDEMLPAGDNRRALAQLFRAHIAARVAVDEFGLERARDRYADLVERAGGTTAYLAALLGLAEMEASLDALPASLEAYTALVQERELREEPAEPSRMTIARSLLGQFEARHGAQDPVHALRFASLAGDMFQLDEMPADLLTALATAHASMADRVLGDRASGLRLRDLRELDPGTLQQAKRHLIRAAGFARAHADRFVLDDYETYGDSLWRAAKLYDRAGDSLSAIATFGSFVETVREDPRRAEARFRLAQAQQARGEYEIAASGYRGLIADRAAAVRDGVGAWADRSHVPLAQCLLLDAEPANDQEAERILLGAVDGTSGGPDRPEFRDALFELGRVFESAGRYDFAIERLDEFLERAGDDPRVNPARYRLADAYRKLAGEIGERLGGELRQSQARTLSRERRGHLQRSMELFEIVRDELAQKPMAYRSELDDVHLRNAHFYLGDCAFDLGEYERAIAYYAAARNRYPRDPAVLVALVQIVNAYVEMGDLRSARTANERARDFYSSLPDDVWDDPSLPMGRRDWERWLDSSARLYDELAQAG